MSQVSFDEQNEFTMRTRNALGQRQPSMVQFVLKTGITQSEKVATFILFFVAAIMIFAAYSLVAAEDPNVGFVVDELGERMTVEEYEAREASGYYKN